jgi:ribonuclease P protein component
MLNRQQRITSDKDFQTIYRRGRHLSSAFFNLNYLGNNLDRARIGVVVNKRVAKKATERNLLKRQLREILRNNYSQIQSGLDLVISTKGPSVKLGFDKLKEELMILLEKAKLTKNA